jgi:hypothetical protein
MTKIETAAVVDSLERAPSILIPLVREIPPDLRRRRPKPGKWSAHEHACHLAEVNPLFLERLDLMLRDPAPRIRPYDPGKAHEEDALLRIDLEEALGRFARDRAAIVARLRGLTPSDWERTAEHPEYARYSVFVAFRHLALHDLLHAYRIEEISLARPA